MNQPLPDARAAGALLVRALNPRLTAKEDKEYAQLLALYSAHSNFAQMVRDIAEGLELRVVGTPTAGALVVVPASATSRFAVRMSDLRNFDDEGRQVFVLICAVLAKLFFPDELALEAETLALQPTSVATMVKSVHEHAIAYREDETHEATASGWTLLASMRERLPNEQRANTRSISGWVRLALKHLDEAGLVRAYAQGNTDADESWYATRRFQLQLRECALPAWFKLVKDHSRVAAAATAAAEAASTQAQA